MTTKPESIDLEKVRKNWERASVVYGGNDGPPTVITEVVDPIRAGHETLARIRALVTVEYAKHRDVLMPFLDRAAELIDAMRTAERKEEERIRAELEQLLNDVEDLLEVYSLDAR